MVTSRSNRNLSCIALALLGSVLACFGAGQGTPPPATPPVVEANPEEVETTLFLIGDAGAPSDDDPVLASLMADASFDPEKSVIVFLGDNVYPRGIPDTAALDRDEAVRRLMVQIETGTETRASTIFVPGNHDWAYMGQDGWNAIRRQDSIITANGDSTVQLLPHGGCPGPVAVDIRLNLRLILLDTQWWLHDWIKPSPEVEDHGCATDTPQEIVDSLEAQFSAAGQRIVIVAGHHPLKTGGLHGGYFTLKSQIFPLRRIKDWLWIPLPIIGSVMPEARRRGISDQDVSGPENRRMREALEGVFERYQPMVYASGHDHNLQVLTGTSARHLLVSGAGYYGHVSAVRYRSDTRYAGAKSGYMRLDLFHNRRVRLAVVTVDSEGNGTESYSTYLE